MADEEVAPETNDEVQDSYDANDPVQINKARKKAGRAKQNDLEMVQAIMDLPTGRSWFYRLLVRCGTFTAPVSDSPHRDAQAAGRQMIGHWVLEDIMNAAPELYWKMIKENAGKK